MSSLQMYILVGAAALFVLILLIMNIAIIANLSAIKKYAKFQAGKLKQLSKLTADNQIFIRGIYNELNQKDSAEGAVPQAIVTNETQK